MKKFFSFKRIILIVVLCLACFAILCACDTDEIVSISVNGKTEILIGNFNYSDYSVEIVYESGRKENVTMTSEMLSAADNVKFFTEGQQTIEVSYKGSSCTFNIDVKPYEFTDLKFDDISTTYTGEVVTAEVFNNYPDGTDVYYPNGNKFVNAGTYEVTAIVSRKNYVTQELKAKVTINKADYDMSSVSFNDQTFDYNGKEHSITISGKLPSGVTVSYPDNNNIKIDAGVYVVSAHFSGDEANYNSIEDRTAKLTINKKKHDTTGLTFNNENVVYDGKEYSIEVKNCPSGVTVTYETTCLSSYELGEDGSWQCVDKTEFGNIKKKYVGEYDYKAIFTSNDKNYEDIASIHATLKISEAEYDVSNLYLEGDEVTYDGESHSLKFKYNGEEGLPEGISIASAYYRKGDKYVYCEDGEYTYGGFDFYKDNFAEGVVDYGTYEYTALLKIDNPNYIISQEFTAILTINKATYATSKIALKEDEFVYNGNDISVSIDEDNLPSDILGHQLKYSLYYFDEQPEYIENTGISSDVGAKKDKAYNNYLIGETGDPVKSVKNAGNYWVMIEFTEQDNDNYNYLQPMIKTFVVDKADAAEILATAQLTATNSFTYDGQNHSVILSNEKSIVADGQIAVAYYYYNKGDEISKDSEGNYIGFIKENNTPVTGVSSIGEYVVVACVSVASSNYEFQFVELQAELIISK